MTLPIGSHAPDFKGTDENGNTVTLSEVLKDTNVVLYFYPKDETPGCTKEACTFRDNWEDISKLGATVIGISSDSVESHHKFKENHSLPFTLISDPDKTIRKAYDAVGALLPPRISYVITKDGTIVHVYNSQMNPAKHVALAKEKLKSIANK
ncbi:MAG: peroxiredoxin [Thermoplasmatales archaeon]|nr:peroxiredoxin [Thermoplasmatales archaeon]